MKNINIERKPYDYGIDEDTRGFDMKTLYDYYEQRPEKLEKNSPILELIASVDKMWKQLEEKKHDKIF